MAEYLRDAARIYRESFAIIRAEADLSRFSEEESDVAVRMVHACGLVEAAEKFVFSADVIAAARGALRAGAPILCDSEMLSHGVTRARLPAGNAVICTLRDPSVPAIAERLQTTRSAAALELWADRLEGAVVAIGNAPTCLFRLLDMLDAGAADRPPSSAFPSASSVPRNPRKRSSPTRAPCPTSRCAAGWVAVP